MRPVDLPALVRETLTAKRWDNIAARCRTGGHCTMACPTRFRTTTEDVTDLTGDHCVRWRRWGSRFDPDFSHPSGGAWPADRAQPPPAVVHSQARYLI